MKKTLITILIIILVILISAFGFACKKEAPVEEVAEEITEEAPADEEVEQSLEAIEEEPVEETPDEETIDEATEEEEVEVIVYSIDSKMQDLLDNPQTMEIMQKYIPDVVNSDRIDESRAFALKLVLKFSGIEEEIIAQLDEDLRNVGSVDQ